MNESYHPSSVVLAWAVAWLLAVVPFHADAQSDGPAESDAPGTVEMTPEAALEAAMADNPTLAGAVVDLKRAELALRSERFRYVPELYLDAQLQHGRRPNLSRDGIISVQNQSASVAAGVRQTLPTGMSISGELSTDRTVQDSVYLGELGTTWGAGATFEVTQSWLRGFGRDVGLAERRTAEAESRAAVARRNDEASRLARDVLTAYWDLWNARRDVDIQRRGLEVAEQALEDGRRRLEAGAIGDSDLIPLRREVASLRETLAESRATRSQRRIELARLLGLETHPEDLEATTAPPTDEFSGDLQTALDRAVDQSYALHEQRQQIEQARVEATVAHNDKLPKLDTTGSVSLSGLGRDLPPAYESLGATDGLVGMISLSLELPLVNKARAADARRADLGVERAELQYESTRDQIEANIRDQFTSLQTARERLELARRTARLSEQNVEYQRSRYRNGAATALDVAETLQEHREAKLRVANLRVETRRRRIALEDLTGSLLERLTLEEVDTQ